MLRTGWSYRQLMEFPEPYEEVLIEELRNEDDLLRDLRRVRGR
jgi:hypothetical protein